MSSTRAGPPRTAMLVLPADNERGRGPGQTWMVLLFFVGLWLTLGFWWLASGQVPVKTTADRLNTIGRLTGLIGTYLLLWQLLLMSRMAWLERAFGMERLLLLHRWNAYVALGLIAIHVAFQTMGYELDSGLSALAQLFDFIEHYAGVLPAIAGFVLLVGITVSSIGFARSGMSYPTWYFVHLYAYLGVALSFAHQLETGSDFIDNEMFVSFWWLLYIGLGALIVWYRFAAPVGNALRHRFFVARVEREASGSISIYIAGRNLDSFEFDPGQFAIWRFLDARRWWEAHPFTFSATPNGEFLRITVKRSGDFSEHAASIRVGTPVLVEGPFGRFTRRSCERSRALLVAGGIGITPIRALAQDLAIDGVNVCVLYRCSHEAELAFRRELDELASAYGVRVEYLLSDRELRGRRGGDWLEPNNLRTLVPDVAERDVFICGPLGLATKVKRTLRILGLSPFQVHTEAFQF